MRRFILYFVKNTNCKRLHAFFKNYKDVAICLLFYLALFNEFLPEDHKIFFRIVRKG